MLFQASCKLQVALQLSMNGPVDFQEFCVFSECVRKFWYFKCTQDVVRQSATFHGTTELHPFSRAKQESTEHDEGKGS